MKIVEPGLLELQCIIYAMELVLTLCEINWGNSKAYNPQQHSHIKYKGLGY